MRFSLCVCLAVLPGFTQADGLPALAEVFDLPPDSALEILDDDHSQAEEIGFFPSGTRDIEVVGISPNGIFAQVNSNEQSGWVRARYLRITSPDWNEGLPSELYCYGTEPFWGFTDGPSGAEFTLPMSDRSMSYDRSSGPTVPFGRQPIEFSAVYLGNGDTMATATIRREQCGDGMSDRTLGLSIILTLIESDSVAVYSGCCSLAP